MLLTEYLDPHKKKTPLAWCYFWRASKGVIHSQAEFMLFNIQIMVAQYFIYFMVVQYLLRLLESWKDTIYGIKCSGVHRITFDSMNFICRIFLIYRNCFHAVENKNLLLKSNQKINSHFNFYAVLFYLI